MKTNIMIILACWLIGSGAVHGQIPFEVKEQPAAGKPGVVAPRLPDRLPKQFFLNNKFLVHSYLWADGTAKPASIVFRKDGTVENERAGLGGETWELVDDTTLRIGKVTYRLDSHQGILNGQVGKTRHSYIWLDIPGEKASTPRQAKSAVWSYITKERGGVDARVGLKVVTNFHLGAAVKGFAKQGDRVWQVHLRNFAAEIGSFDASEIFWVNARSGEVRPLYPMKTD